MADEQVTKPRASVKKKAATASKKSAKKPAAKKPAAKKPVTKKPAAKKPAAKKTAPKKATASKAAAKPAVETPEQIVESPTMNQESTSDSANNDASGRETFTKDPHLEPTGTLADKIWRLIAMTAFAMIAYFAIFGVIVLAAVQFVVVVLDDKPSAEVGGYMFRLNSFLQEIVAFLSFSSHDLPFPFMPFSGSDDA